MTGNERIIVDLILRETVKEFKVINGNTAIQHSAALILTETYLTPKDAAGALSITEKLVDELSKVAGNAFWDSKPYRRRIYKVITNVHQQASFERPKKNKIITKYDLPGLRTSGF